MWTSAAASPIVIWRVAGRAVNGSGTAPPERSAIQARTWGRHAPPWHGPTPASVDRLMQLQLLKALAPGDVEVLDGHVVAAAHHRRRIGGWRWQDGVHRRITHDPHAGTRHGPGHPGEDVAGREPKSQDRRVARCLDIDAAARIGGDDGPDPTPVVAQEPDELPEDALAGHALRGCPDGHGATQVHARRMKPLGRTGGHETRQVVAWHRRLELRRAGRDDDLAARRWSIPCGVLATMDEPG